MQNVLTYAELKAYQRQERDSWPNATSVRTHRALSWLNRAEQETADPDAAFVFLWMSFNALYARIIEEDSSATEREKYALFIRQLLISDYEKRIDDLLFNQFSDSMTSLVENRYVFHDYWQRLLYPENNIDWEQKLNSSINSASYALRERKTEKFLLIILSRIQVLRNQVIHGASTWNGGKNRQQIQDAAAVLRLFVPITIYIMMNDPTQEWGDPLYPVQHDDN